MRPTCERKGFAYRAMSAVVALAVAGTTLVPSVAEAAQPTTTGTTSEGAKRLNAEAQDRYARGDLVGAGDTYARIFDELDENKVNREERDNTLLITLEVYREAFFKRKNVPGTNSLKEAAEYLRKAVRVFDAYEEEYRRVYGSGATVSLEAAESGKKTKDLLADADRKLGVEKAPKPEKKPDKPPPPIWNPNPVPRGPSGVGLIVGGSILIAAGLGTMVMIIVGDSMVKKARTDAAAAETDPELEDANQRGQTGNALIISGAVFTALFIAGGATMLGIGIHRRIRYVAFTPTMGRGYAGFSLRGRF